MSAIQRTVDIRIRPHPPPNHGDRVPQDRWERVNQSYGVAQKSPDRGTTHSNIVIAPPLQGFAGGGGVVKLAGMGSQGSLEILPPLSRYPYQHSPPPASQNTCSCRAFLKADPSPPHPTPDPIEGGGAVGGGG